MRSLLSSLSLLSLELPGAISQVKRESAFPFGSFESSFWIGKFASTCEFAHTSRPEEAKYACTCVFARTRRPEEAKFASTCVFARTRRPEGIKYASTCVFARTRRPGSNQIGKRLPICPHNATGRSQIRKHLRFCPYKATWKQPNWQALANLPIQPAIRSIQIGKHLPICPSSQRSEASKLASTCVFGQRRCP